MTRLESKKTFITLLTCPISPKNWNFSAKLITADGHLHKGRVQKFNQSSKCHLPDINGHRVPSPSMDEESVPESGQPRKED